MVLCKCKSLWPHEHLHCESYPIWCIFNNLWKGSKVDKLKTWHCTRPCLCLYLAPQKTCDWTDENILLRFKRGPQMFEHYVMSLVQKEGGSQGSRPHVSVAAATCCKSMLFDLFGCEKRPWRLVQDWYILSVLQITKLKKKHPIKPRMIIQLWLHLKHKMQVLTNWHKYWMYFEALRKQCTCIVCIWMWSWNICDIIPGEKKRVLIGKNNWSERKCLEWYCIVLHELP